MLEIKKLEMNYSHETIDSLGINIRTDIIYKKTFRAKIEIE